MRLERLHYLIDGIFGILHVTDKLQFATLEHSYPDTFGGLLSFLPKLPHGNYKCVRGKHQLHSMNEPFETFEITGVEGHTNILFHMGNFNKDSEGCVLLGEHSDDHMVFESRKAFDEFMKSQIGINEFQLEVT